MIGRNAIDGVLGRGGAYMVYAAADRLLGRPVAVKVFTDRADSTEHLREQEAEARLVARLNHPGLTTLLDAGVEVEGDAPPQLYLVLERDGCADAQGGSSPDGSPGVAGAQSCFPRLPRQNVDGPELPWNLGGK